MRGSLIFLWVGRLEKNKDPITVIKGFLFYALTHKEAKLYMIYQSHELLEEISILMKNSSQKDSIILIGKIPYEELFYWYSSADILISGSHYEGSGTAIAEAMSCGCMPILTDIFPFRMLTNNEKCGYLFQPGNPESLGKILMELKEEEVLLRKKLAFQFFQSHLSFQAIAKKIQDISSGF
jgi:glycosyltransferase involved in cell wall biosynthesis